MIDSRIQWWLVIASLLLWVMSPVKAGDSETDPVKISFPDLDGNMHDLAQYRGKWVVVNYWATSCPPCIEEIPELAEFHARHKEKDAVVVGVNHEQIPITWLRQFMNTVPINYPVLRSRPSRATPFGFVQMLPTTYIVSPDGKSIARQLGAVTAEQLDAYIKSKTEQQ